MEKTVYVDLLFLINFSMDFLCFFLVAKLLSKKLSLWRGALSSALGGIYSVASLFWETETVMAPALHLLFCLIMCLVTFAGKNDGAVSMLVVTGAYFLSSMLLGGIMTAIFNLMNSVSPPLTDFTQNRDMPLWLFAAIAVISTVVTRIGGLFLRTRAQIRSVDVEIRLGNRNTIIRAMCDSGNLLRDAVSGRSVIVADTKCALNLLPYDCPTIAEWTCETVASLPPSVAKRVRIIPTSTANAESVMFALRPDAIVIRNGDHTHTADALIGFADIRCPLRDCTAILPPELIT